MAISKTQWGWMTLGGMLCLFGVVLTCQLKDGNRASAQTDDSGIPLVVPVLPGEKKSVEIEVTPDPDNQDKPLPPLKKVKMEPIRSGSGPKAALPQPTPIAPSLVLPLISADPARTEPAVKTDNILADPPPALPTAAPNIPQPTFPAWPVWTAPIRPTAPVSRVEYRTEGEPPLAPRPGPIQVYHVRHDGETPREIARRTLGGNERLEDVIKLNPSFKADATLQEGTKIFLPADACIPVDEVETVKPLPVLRKPVQNKARVLPLTGTFPCNLDEKHTLILPRAIRDQLSNSDTVLVSPGPDLCLWVTNHAHLERLAERLEHSPAREAEVRVFRRLYYAQTEKITLTADGRVQIPERLVQFAGLHQEVVLVGIDDHFELWDVTRWKQYTQQQSSAARGIIAEE